jgi:hypothetical protein
VIGARARGRVALLAATLASLAGAGCRSSAAADTVAAPPPPARDRLPEDPVAGARSSAQWREHMAWEERERRLHFDRDRLHQHREVVRFLVAARARLDRARTPAAVRAAAARLPPAIAEQRRRIAEIDHWGTSSNLLGDYDAALTALADDYPAARAGALAGDGAALDRVRADLDARLKKIAAWLAEAAASKDE